MRGVLVRGVQRGMEDVCPEHYNEVSKFVSEFVPVRGEPLSDVDKDLVSRALSCGDGHALLTADEPMIEAYVAIGKKFGLNDSVVCDSTRCWSYRIGSA